MNPKPKGVSGSHFVGLDIFRRTLTVVDEKKGGFQGGYSTNLNIQNQIILIDGQLANIEDDYVILLSGELRIGEGHYYLSEYADEVTNAGQIGIENGKVTYLNNWSGHYRPTKDDVIDAKIFFEQNQLTGDIFVSFIPFK